AALTGNLYSAEVAVLEKSPEEKTRGAALALAEVLVKMSGDRRIAEHPAAAPLLASAEDYVQQFRFTPNDTLLVGFDGRNLQRAMREARLPVWGNDRPATLLWLAVDFGGGERRLLSADDHGEVRTQIEAAAAARGVPLIWPLNDSTDRASLTVADVWGGYSEMVDEASVRYAPDAILVGRISRSSNGSYFGNWHLQLQGEHKEWRDGLGDSVHRLSDYYAVRLASVATTQDNAMVSMLISGLDDGRAYIHALSTLEKLGAIESVQVREARGSTVRVNLKLRGSADQLRRSLGFSRVLVPDNERDSAEFFNYRYAR
ncbi:MAG: DUF2066 domain-containing protein, partial [Gammaproteobacteria bacterium]|nr:DUF2066 domain-containing protein [Gammaproteobacteria bacterium]